MTCVHCDRRVVWDPSNNCYLHQTTGSVYCRANEQWPLPGTTAYPERERAS